MKRARPTLALAVSVFVLTACGGGAPGTSAGSVANAQVAHAAAGTESQSGTTIPSASSIVDSSSQTWTVVNGVVKVNGANAGFTDQVTLLLYYNGVIYQQNVNQLWWKWQNNTWVSTTDPRAAVAKAAAGGGVFYGVNGHIIQGGAYARTTMATQISQLKDLGMTLYRNDVSSAAEAATVAQLADAGNASGVNVYPVLTPNYRSPANESAAYSDGYSLGQSAAHALVGKVKYYEVGNEFGDDMIACSNCDGTKGSDFDNTLFQKARGEIRGMIDGIKSVDTNAQIIMTATSWLHTGFTDMLWNGTQPDGSGGHPKVTWDITSWHWYSDMGDITRAGGSNMNVLQYLHNAYGKPIFLTETGVRPGMSDSATASYLVGNTMLAEYQADASQYNIQSVDIYELYDDASNGGDGNYGLFTDTGTTQRAAYAAVKTFIAAHPMN
jgi:Glycosyl hydrolase catalytic core